MNVERNAPYDLFVIVGGINGAAVACDAAGRGLSVALAEERDFAEGTSSRSSKLIHGGLRYLETCDFRLVREALRPKRKSAVVEVTSTCVLIVAFLFRQTSGRPAGLNS